MTATEAEHQPSLSERLAKLKNDALEEVKLRQKNVGSAEEMLARTKTLRLEAIKVAAGTGVDLSDLAAVVGMSESTIGNWVRPPKEGERQQVTIPMPDKDDAPEGPTEPEPPEDEPEPEGETVVATGGTGSKAKAAKA